MKVLGLMILVIICSSARAEDSLVSSAAQISDFAIKHQEARLLSYDQDTLEDALKIYQGLKIVSPNNTELLLELAKLYVRANKPEFALKEFEIVYASGQLPNTALLEMADVYLYTQDLEKAVLFYRKAYVTLPSKIAQRKLGLALSWQHQDKEALALLAPLYATSNQDKELILELSRLYARGGEVSRAITLLTPLLEAEPNDAALVSELADLEAKRGHAKRAHDLYQSIVTQDRQILLRYAAVAQIWGDFYKAEALYRDLLKPQPKDHEINLKLAWVLGSQERYEEAKEIYLAMRTVDLRDQTVLLAWAKLEILRKDFESARALLDELLKINQKNQAALELVSSLGQKAKVEPIVEGNTLEEQAEVFLAKRDFANARIRYQEILERDPQYFPAELKLAELEAASENYEASIERYRSLLVDFPGSRKLIIGLARVLAWSRRYDEALEQYALLEKLYIFDPVVKVEKGRTAYWAKDIEKSSAFYQELFTPSEPVEVSCKIKQYTCLEASAKKFAWDRRPREARRLYEELLKHDPGNEEANFDYAQLACALGLEAEAQAAYKKLLDLNSNHNLATQALKKELIKQQSKLAGYSWFWREEGRGGLSDITRRDTQANLELPVFSRFWLELGAHYFQEKPHLTGKYYDAFAPELGMRGRFDSDLRIAAKYRYKNYEGEETEDFDSTSSGNIELWWDRDVLDIGVGYQRSDELYNYFGLRQATQSDQLWTGLRYDITHALDGKATFRYLDYSDSNHGVQLMPSIGYAFSEQPRVFKVTLGAEYRDTGQDNQFIYSGDILENIVHPYWAPKDYVSGFATLEWYEDLSRRFYCGNDLHFIDAKLTLKTDSEENPGGELRLEWHREFASNWSMELQALMHRSKDWDAEALFFTLSYQGLWHAK